MTITVRRFATVAVLAAGLFTSVSPVHGQAPSVSSSVRAVLKPLYQSLDACTYGTQQIRPLAMDAVVGSLQNGGVSQATGQDGLLNWPESSRVQLLASLAAGSASSCGIVVRLVRHTQLSGQLARNLALRHVLDQLAAYAAGVAGGDYYFVKVATDIQSDDAASAQVDIDHSSDAWHSADGHLSMVASYIGKL